MGNFHLSNVCSRRERLFVSSYNNSLSIHIFDRLIAPLLIAFAVNSCCVEHPVYTIPGVSFTALVVATCTLIMTSQKLQLSRHMRKRTTWNIQDRIRKASYIRSDRPFHSRRHQKSQVLFSSPFPSGLTAPRTHLSLAVEHVGAAAEDDLVDSAGDVGVGVAVTPLAHVLVTCTRVSRLTSYLYGRPCGCKEEGEDVPKSLCRRRRSSRRPPGRSRCRSGLGNRSYGCRWNGRNG